MFYDIVLMHNFYSIYFSLYQSMKKLSATRLQDGTGRAPHYRFDHFLVDCLQHWYLIIVTIPQTIIGAASVCHVATKTEMIVYIHIHLLVFIANCCVDRISIVTS